MYNNAELLEFIERVCLVTDTEAPIDMRAGMRQEELVFLSAIAEGEIETAYQALCRRYEATGHNIDGSRWFSGYAIGPLVLSQCTEFAIAYGINDPRLPRMIKHQQLLEMVDALENYPAVVGFDEETGEMLYEDGSRD